MDEPLPTPHPGPPPAGDDRPARYRRVPHRVLAEVLRERWAWCTATGDALVGAPGDYRLTDPESGDRWSVTARALALGYRAVGAGVYESRGEVDARRLQDADGPRDVLSLEGTEVARAGDWIVSDPDGNSWVVADAWFRTRYRAAPAVRAAAAPGAAGPATGRSAGGPSRAPRRS